jgi:prepilin-type N-terminal cleavage/methylation domain-containing protein
MNRFRRAAGDEHGFTLLEVLMTIAISAIVLSTITLAVAQGFSETSQAGGRLDRSNLADFAADIFAADAASSSVTGQPAAPCGTGPTFLDVAQSDGTSVSYAIRASGTGSYTLVRRTCDGVTVSSRRLGSASAPAAPSTAGSTCPTGSAAMCTLKVTWGDGNGNFTLTGTRRAG